MPESYPKRSVAECAYAKDGHPNIKAFSTTSYICLHCGMVQSLGWFKDNYPMSKIIEENKDETGIVLNDTIKKAIDKSFKKLPLTGTAMTSNRFDYGPQKKSPFYRYK